MSTGIDEGMERALCEQRRGAGWAIYDEPCNLAGCSCRTDPRVLALIDREQLIARRNVTEDRLEFDAIDDELLRRARVGG